VRSALTFESEVYGIESYGRFLWIEAGVEEAPKLVRVDSTSEKIVATIDGSSPEVIGSDLWFSVGGREVRADPLSGQIRERFSQAGHPAVGAGSLWLATGDEKASLTRIDLITKKKLATVALADGEAKSIEFFAGAVWVVVDGSDLVVKVDPKTNKVVAKIPAGSRPHSSATGFGSIWVTDHGEATLVRIDPSRNKVVARIADVGGDVAVTVAGDSVWVATPDGVGKVDPDTNKAVSTLTLVDTGDYYDVAVAGGSLWLTTGGGGDSMKVYRIDLF
jgi:YVTN family beta-propeller protein